MSERLILSEIGLGDDYEAGFGECDLCEHRQLADFMTHDDHAMRPMYRVGGSGFTVCENCLPDFLGDP